MKVKRDTWKSCIEVVLYQLEGKVSLSCRTYAERPLLYVPDIIEKGVSELRTADWWIFKENGLAEVSARLRKNILWIIRIFRGLAWLANWCFQHWSYCVRVCFLNLRLVALLILVRSASAICWLKWLSCECTTGLSGQWSKGIIAAIASQGISVLGGWY